MTGVAEVFITVCVKNVRADEVAERAAHKNVGWEVIASGEASRRDSECCTIGDDLYPALGIFVSDDARHGPREHGVARWEGSVDASVLPEAAVAGAVVRPFASGNDLHRRVDQEGVGERFEGQVAGFLRVRIVGADAVKPDEASTGSSGADTKQRYVVTDIDVILGNRSGSLTVGGKESAGGQQEERVPFEVLAFEGCGPEFFLVFESTLEVANQKTLAGRVSRRRVALTGLIGKVR